MKKWMKTYEELKLWSLIFGLNGIRPELIGPQTNNILSITLGQTTTQKVLKIFYYWPQDFLTSTPNLK